ncbi:magnesium transporter MgtE N-terminal domain-containing protein [Paenibacillus wenxiniae]|uniref:Magnesium transporter MgtE N-terminal domain-containing protein n=1 Tax=Paenibacillus wenxiniae TaxID=1636843 RepID=A0ABW4RPX3_9BACL
MAKKTMDLEVEKEGGGLGRFLVIATPILFTLVLVGAMIMLFNSNLRNTMFSTLDKIPIVKNFVPSADNTSSANPATNQAESTAATVDQLKQQLTDAQQKNSEQATQIKTLQDQLNTKSGADNTAGTSGAGTTGNGTTGTTTNGTSTTNTGSPTVQTEQDKQLKNLANVYSDMSSSKAASIMQNMTTDEQVLIFSKMNSESQAGILQKMDPKVAAETSMALKNATAASLAALQVKTASNQKSTPTTGTKLDSEAMAQTFTTMPASSAASLLLQTSKTSQTKVLQILNSLDDTTRAGILSAMSTQDPAATAQIVNRLMGN